MAYISQIEERFSGFPSRIYTLVLREFTAVLFMGLLNQLHRLRSLPQQITSLSASVSCNDFTEKVQLWSVNLLAAAELTETKTVHGGIKTHLASSRGCSSLLSEIPNKSSLVWSVRARNYLKEENTLDRIHIVPMVSHTPSLAFCTTL